MDAYINLDNHDREFVDTEYFRKGCEFYGITVEEGKRRHQVCMEQGDDPSDPICVGCAKRPEELGCYSDVAGDQGMTPTEYVLDQEGTFNKKNGHFLCDECYIKNGMPSSERGWVCP